MVNILLTKQTSIFSAATVIMSTVMVSRVLGLIRNRLLTAQFNPDEIGIYLAAFRLPTMMFELLIMGALSTAFIPVFTKLLTRNSEETAWRVAASTINISIAVVSVISAFLLAFTPAVCKAIAPGLNSQELSQMIIFTRIMLIGQAPFLIIGSFITGILQSYKHFLVPALAPVAYNLGIIFGITFLSPFLGLYGPVLGVVFGSGLFVLVQIPVLRHVGYHHSGDLDIKSPGVREIGKLTAPRILGLAVSQVNTTVNLALSSILGTRNITIFNFAQQLDQLPVSLFGATIAQATLPTLSEEEARGHTDEFKEVFLNSLRQILFLILPAAAILIVLRIPLVRLAFGAAKFDWDATVLTGRTLAFFGLGLTAESLVHIFVRGFYALHDSKTPMVLGAISVFLNIILSIFFINHLYLPIWSLALSTSLSDILYILLLLYLLDKKIGSFDRKKIFSPFFKMLTAAVLTGVSLYIPMKLLDQLVFDTTKTVNLILLTTIAGSCGLSVYVFFSYILKIPELSMVLVIAKKIRSFPASMRESQPLVEDTGS